MKERNLRIPYYKFSYPKEGYSRSSKLVYILFLIALLFFTLSFVLPGKENIFLIKDMKEASRMMEHGISVIQNCRKEKGITIDSKTDINKTGLIGLEHSSITTSIGNLEAKRTSTNPDFGALLVLLLKKAGVQSGDSIGVGASGSFPSLIIAILSACKVLDVNPLLIFSLGASQWGANNPEFNWLDMMQCLKEKGIFNYSPLAVSLGGHEDRAEEMDESGKAMLLQQIKASGLYFIAEPNLQKNVKKRFDLYKQGKDYFPFKAFVNIGGSWSTMGTDSLILEVKPGLTEITKFPPVEKQGLIMAMAAKNIPVIHCLYIKGLAQKYGLAWDSSPFPKPGEGGLYRTLNRSQSGFLLLAGSGLLFCLLAMVGMKKKGF